MQTIKKLIFLLNANERKKSYLLVFMITIMALLDMVGVASILPFMAVVSNPNLIDTNFFLNFVFQKSNLLGVKTTQHFMIFMGFAVFILLVLSLSFKALTTLLQVRFVQMREYTIGKRLLEGYLNQPYSWFLSRHSSDLGKTILTEISQVINSGLRHLMEIIAKGMVTVAMIVLLILVDVTLAIVVGASLGSIYLIIFFFVKKFLKKIGKERLKNNELRFKSISEAFGAIKEVKVGSLENIYIRNFSISAKQYAQNHASSQIVAQLPRFIIEIIAFGGILLIILQSISINNNFNSILPIISLYVLAGYRLMPAIQTLYTSSTQLTFVKPSIDKLHYDLNAINANKKNIKEIDLSFTKEIVLNDIFFNYPNKNYLALNNINLKIPARKKVGFVGTTGSGKTTIIDIILGLLEPKKGTLEVDGILINNSNKRNWQRLIGYVPQNIYLLDQSIAENIALGVEASEIDQDHIEKVSKIANLHNFVIQELPDKYQTKIGEKGINLSGGQRQRIGIARALYHKPKVLILDEATSALDNYTENMVIEAINNFDKEVTTIVIAHRINSLRYCDIIFQIENGELKKQDNYHNMIKILV